MSRRLEYNNERGQVKETIADMNKCKHLCNYVCCCERSVHVGDMVDDVYCNAKWCPHFLQEDGIITE